MLHTSSYISESELNAALSTAIEQDRIEDIKQLLNHPQLKLTPEAIFHYLHTTATRIDSNKISAVLSCLFSHPRVYSTFHHFSDDKIKQLWDILNLNYSYSMALASWDVFVFNTLIHAFKKNSHFTFENAKNLLPGLESIKNSKFYFEFSKKIATYPERFFFYFGFEMVLELFISQESIDVPALKDESEDAHFVRCVTTVLTNPLHSLALNSYTTEYQPILELLLRSSKIDINQKDELCISEETILHIAIRKKHASVVRFLLNQGSIDLTVIDRNGNTLLHTAMQNVHDEILQMLLQCPRVTQHIHATDNRGNTPLHVGLNSGHIPGCKALLSFGFSEFDAMNQVGETPLYLIAKNDKNAEIIGLFFETFEITKDFFNRHAPFFVAARHGNKKLAEILLYDTRMDLTITDSEGRTPLHVAVEMHNLEAVQFLIQQKQVDVNATQWGKTPLHIAADHCIKHPEVFFMLFTHPATNINYEHQFDLVKKTLLDHILAALEKAKPHQAIQFLDQYAHLLFNDSRIDPNLDLHFWRSDLFSFVIKIDHVVMFKIWIERVYERQSNLVKNTVLNHILPALEKAEPHQAIRFLDQYAHLLFNDSGIDPNLDLHFWRSNLFPFAIKIDHIVMFKIWVDRVRKAGVSLFLPDLEEKPKELALHHFMKESPQIVAYYAVLSVLKTNQEFTYDQVFEALKQQAFPKWETWTDQQKLKAFYHAQCTLGIIAPHVFAQVVFLSDGLLEIEKSSANSNTPDTDAVLGAKKFFRIASQLPLELQMTLCNAVGGVKNQKDQVKEVIPQQNSEFAFKKLALTLMPQ